VLDFFDLLLLKLLKNFTGVQSETDDHRKSENQYQYLCLHEILQEKIDKSGASPKVSKGGTSTTSLFARV
jgi:hypothetical protein